MHVTESTNPTPVSVVTSPSCVGVSLIQLMMIFISTVYMFLNRNLVCVQDENPFVSTIYCLHNTGFQICKNKLSWSCVYIVCVSDHILISKSTRDMWDILEM